MTGSDGDVLFLDANVLFSAAYRSDAVFRMLWRFPGTRIVTSTYVIDEVLRNLRSVEHRRDLLTLLDASSVYDSVGHDAEPISEVVHLAAKDRPVLVDALATRSSHLLTSDLRHFGWLYGRSIAGILVMHPREYLRQRLEE